MVFSNLYDSVLWVGKSTVYNRYSSGPRVTLYGTPDIIGK